MYSHIPDSNYHSNNPKQPVPNKQAKKTHEYLQKQSSNLSQLMSGNQQCQKNLKDLEQISPHEQQQLMLQQIMLKYSSVPSQHSTESLVMSARGGQSGKDQMQQEQRQEHSLQQPQKIQNKLPQQPQYQQHVLQHAHQRVNSICHTEEENFVDADMDNANCIRDLIYDHNENPHIQALQHMQKHSAEQRQSISNYHPKLSKSPTPNLYHNTSQVTPKSIGDLRNSQKYPYILMNQQDLERVNQRNNQQHIIPNSKSHQAQMSCDYNILKEKKKSISSSGQNSSNGTLNNGKQLKLKEQQVIQHQQQQLQQQQQHQQQLHQQQLQASQAQQTNKDQPPHKKSQSLYNKKIVEIISGLQQSLGVIASNVRSSFENQNEGDTAPSSAVQQNQQKALLESALLAQKLAQMTQNMNQKVQLVEPERQSHQNTVNNYSSRRKSSKTGSNGPQTRQSSYKRKDGYKTIEEPLMEHVMQKAFNQNRISMDSQIPIRGHSSKSSHQRTKSDLQQPRKKVVTAGVNGQPQQVVNTYHQKQKTLLTCSSSSIDNTNPISYSIGQSLKQEYESKAAQHQIVSQTAKNVTKITLSKSSGSQQNSSNNSSNHTKISRKQEVASLVESTLSDLAIAAKHYNTNCYPSGNASIVSATLANNTIEQSRQSVNLGQQILPLQRSGERVSDAKLIMDKKKVNLVLSSGPGMQGQGEQRLKSAASSPSLHSQLPLKKQQIKQNNVFNFNQQHIVTANMKNTAPVNQQKAVTSKKKTIVGSKDKSAQGGHKRATSDGSSLTKMFHFKQQMLINKIFSQTNNPTAVGEAQQAKKQSNQPTAAVTQNNSLAVKQKSSLSSKRLSNEENQENMHINYQSPRLNHKMEAPSSQQALGPKISQDMKVFLQKFKDKTNMVNNAPQVSQSQSQMQKGHQQVQQKQLLIQAIQSNNNSQIGSRAQTASGIADQSSIGNYMSTSGSNNNTKVKAGQPANLKVKTVNIENIIISSDQIKRQSHQITSKKPLGGHHKRAKSDLLKQPTLPAKPQSSLGMSSGSNKMFFLNLNNQPTIQASLQVASVTRPGVQSQNNIYSARASPQNIKNTYYNFDDTQKQGQGQANLNASQKSNIPTARSDKSLKGPILMTKSAGGAGLSSAMSNQTTQKKNTMMYGVGGGKIVDSAGNFCSDTPQFNYLSSGEMPKARLQYGDDNMMGGGAPSSIYQTNAILQSQQFTRLANMFYGLDNTSSALSAAHKSHKNNGNTIYSTGDQNEQNDSVVYSIVNEDPITYPSQMQQLQGSEHSQKRLTIQTCDQSPKLKIQPTPKVAQPGGAPTQSQNFMIAPSNQSNGPLPSQASQRNINNPMVSQASNREFEGQNFQTFESNMTSLTMNNNMTPRSKEKHHLIKQIKVSFNKLKQPMKTTSEFYRIGKMLGKGAFGRVNLAIHKLCEQLVAVKSINKHFLTEDESSKKKVMQEVQILQRTRHKNIVRLYDSFESNKHIVFVMELCAGGDLLNYVRKRRKLKEDSAKFVFRQVVEGLQYCHSKGIVHRDMKLDNLLLDESGTVKICDFGVSRQLTSSHEIMTEQCGTPAYIAPEILKDKGYRGFGVDIWSLGVCLYALLYGTVPFKANNMSELHQLILKAKYSLKDEKAEITDDAKSLIKALLEPEPSKRITMEQIKQHPWLQEAYEEGFKVEIFSEQEKETIRKDFTYQDMSRYKRNRNKTQFHKDMKRIDNEGNGGIVTTNTEEQLFTEHALDSTQNALMKNCSTKSIVLAPFNSTRSQNKLEDGVDSEGTVGVQELQHDIDRNMIVDKRVIKYAPRVKDINRQYEMNNNCELDNGVYNQFVKQSTDGGDKSLNNSVKDQNCAAPLQTQNSEEDIEAELIKRNQMQGQSELQTFLLQQNSQLKDNSLLIDYEVIEKVETYGYPRQFILTSLEHFDMNDAATCYFLLDKERQYLEDQGMLLQF